MSSLAAEISALANPTPQFDDPEDNNDDTAAQLTGKYDKDEVVVNSSKLRRYATPLLDEEDKRYKGKQVSRQLLEDGSEDSLEESGEDLSDDDENDDDMDLMANDIIMSSGDDTDSDEQHVKRKMKSIDVAESKSAPEKNTSRNKDKKKHSRLLDKNNDFEGDSSNGDETEDDDFESEEGEEVDNIEGMEEDLESNQGSAIRSFSHTSVDEEVTKGRAVQAQLGIWDSLLETRIRLQQVLIVVNQLPQIDLWKEVYKTGGEDYRELVKDGQQKMFGVLEQLVELQTALLGQNPDTKSLAGSQQASKGKTPKVMDDDDEEITSSESDSEEKSSTSRYVPQKRKLKVEEYPDFVCKRHKEFRPYRDQVLQKWHDKTKVAAGKLTKGFTAFEQSILKQVQQILSDQQRLVKRTQLKRSAYNVIGKVEDSKKPEDTIEDENNAEMLQRKETLKDYDEEIFDDDDFYHHMLRELIERKTSNTNDPVELTRQWLEVQKLRRKVKRHVDTKASKDRKIRYHVHPKLMNLMASSDKSKWTDEQRDELFSSLFGKRHNEAVIAEKNTSTSSF